MPVPMPMATDPMVPILMATDPMLPTPTTPLARGPLMLSPLLMLMLTMDTTAMPVPMPMDTDPMVPTPTELDTTDTGKPAIPTKIPSEFQKSATTSENDLKFPFL